MFKIVKMLVVLVAVLALSTPASAVWTDWTENKFNSTRANDKMGADSAVDVSGNIGIIGGWQANQYGTNSGAAYLFDVTTGAQLVELVPTGGTPGGALFGLGTAIQGNLAAVGARVINTTYLFDVTTGNEIAKIEMPVSGTKTNPGFGATVLLSGDGNTLAVGAEWNHEFFIFDVSTPSSPVQLGAAFDADHAGAVVHDETGYAARAVALSDDGNTLITGAILDGATNWKGAAWVDDLSGLTPGAGTTTSAELDPLYTRTGDEQTFIGTQVDIDGNIAMVSGTGVGGDSADPLWRSGAAFLFDVSDPAAPVKLSTIVPDDPAKQHHFGNDVGISGDTVIVTTSPPNGVPGEAYLFDVSDPENPAQLEKLNTAGVNFEIDRFGANVDIDGNIAVVGAPEDDDEANNSGAVYIYTGPPIVSPAAGDINGDGKVDLADVGYFEAQFGMSGLSLPPGENSADLDADGDVDLDDLVFIRDTLGYVSAAAPSAATPEPATMTVLALGGMLVLRRRRQRI